MVMLMGGNDATVLPGITDYTLLKLIAVIGTDLSSWKTEKHFVSWLKLCPIKNRSGKINKRFKDRYTTRGGQIFKEIAHSLIASKYIALGAFGRRLRNLKGSPVAIKAMARKLAVLFYRLVTKGLEYTEKGIEAYEKQYQQTKMRVIEKQLRKTGMRIVTAT